VIALISTLGANARSARRDGMSLRYKNLLDVSITQRRGSNQK